MSGMSAEVGHTSAGDVDDAARHNDAALAQVIRAEVGHTGAGDVDDAALAQVIGGHTGAGALRK